MLPLSLALVAFAASQEEAPSPPPIDRGDARSAANVIGLDLSDEELTQMLPGLVDSLREFEALRAPSIANSVPPATVFGPFLPGMERHLRVPSDDDIENSFEVREPARPDDLEELAFWPLADIASLVRRQEVSCVELTRMYIERLERLDRELHCVITFTRDRALAQAMRLDSEIVQGQYRGPLHGIPWGVKDLMAVEGFPTTWGAAPFKDQVIDETATVVRKLDEAGAVLIAKLSVGALAMGDVWFEERTRSPWNLERGSSGSSAGSASATAAGGVAFALGTETLGSIVSPSVACSTSALRPTFGRVSRHGTMALSWTMDKVGPITRYVDDARLVFRAIEGRDPLDPYSRDRRAAPFQDAQNVPSPDEATGLRIGVVPGAFRRAAELEPVLDELRALGHDIVEVTLPEYPVSEMLCILSAEAATAFDELTRSNRDDELTRQGANAWPNLFRTARLIPAVEYLRAQRLRTQLMRAVHEALANVDALVHAPYSGGLLRLTNLTGHPTIAAPFVGEAGPRRDGSPRTVCFTGQLDGDELLLDLVSDWQRANRGHVLHPRLEWLTAAVGEGR